MDRKTSGLDFAIIGHQDSWKNIVHFVNGIREEVGPLPDHEVRSIFPYLPPRDVFRVEVKSSTGNIINGVYIETFIDPEKLDHTNSRSNVSKVLAAMNRAAKLGAKVVALGGFCSIVLEGNLTSAQAENTTFTSGNTLTSAFIAKGIEQAARKNNIELSHSNLLVVGATGDIGLALVSYFKHKVGKILITARNQSRLEALRKSLESNNIRVKASTDYSQLVPYADVIVFVSSSSGMNLSGCKPHAVICDAGYPKNLDPQFHINGIKLFHGGMGQVLGGYKASPDYTSAFYNHPSPNIIHGCILEAMVLAFEKNFKSYSWGKGNIRVSGMEEIFEWSNRNGVTLAPFYNSNGTWK